MIDHSTLISVFGNNPHRFENIGKEATKWYEKTLKNPGFNWSIAVLISCVMIDFMARLINWINYDQQQVDKLDHNHIRQVGFSLKRDFHLALYCIDTPGELRKSFCNESDFLELAETYMLSYRNSDKQEIMSLEKFAGFLLFVLKLYGRARPGSSERDLELVDNYRLVKNGLVDLLAWIDMMY